MKLRVFLTCHSEHEVELIMTMYVETFLMSESDSVVVRALVSHPVDQGSNLASAILFFVIFRFFPKL